MRTINYNKAVRDRITDIIRASGKECIVRQASPAEFLSLLEAKLAEEVAEYQESPSIEELADIVEVIRAILALQGSTWEQLEDTREQKAAKRGAFVERLVLESADA
ncbi:MAG: nucleoside triphosphate pyrophosphohydrolase [Peptococcaceae bacterium]|nr:nucleoside triphosphate pyrophosphohydrolase [Peptococcaceae bacterium]